MGRMEPVKRVLDEALSMKNSRRKRLAALSFKEKVRIVVQMQQMQAPILRARGISVKVWKLHDR